MKKFFKTGMAVMIGLSLTFTACKKDESKTDGGNNNGTPTVTQEQKATLFYFGGNWCPPCGAYGKPAKEMVKMQAPKKAVIISCQLNSSSVPDPMNNADANALAGLFKVSVVPAMWNGGFESPFAQIQSTSNMSSDALTAVTTMAANKAKANFNLSVKEEDGLMNVTIDGKFFEDLTGEYYIAGYLLEDKLNYPQASDASNEKNIHHNVLRAKFGTSITGELLATNPKKDESIKKSIAFFVQSTFKKENLGAAIVVWKKGSTGFTICNSSYIKF